MKPCLKSALSVVVLLAAVLLPASASAITVSLNGDYIKAFCAQPGFKCKPRPEYLRFYDLVYNYFTNSPYDGRAFGTFHTTASASGPTVKPTLANYVTPPGMLSVVREDWYDIIIDYKIAATYPAVTQSGYSSGGVTYVLTVIGEVPSGTNYDSISAGSTAPQILPPPIPLTPAQPAKHLGPENACAAPGSFPIDMAGGNMYDAFTDYASAGQDSLSFTRYYNSLASTTAFAAGAALSTFGNNWRSTFDRYLSVTLTNGVASAVTAQRADGQELKFRLSGSAWVSDGDVDVKLVQSGTSWMLTDRSDTVETYTNTNAAGLYLVTSIAKRNGYTQALSYDANNVLASVTDSYARTLTFATSDGLLQSVAAPDGLVVSYAYSASGANGAKLDRLKSASYSTTPATTVQYVYENTALPFALTGVIDETGNRFLSWTYDSTGRGLTSQRAGGADLTAIAYDDEGAITINALGAQTRVPFAAGQNGLKASTAARLGVAGVSAANSTSTYDSNGFVATQTDWRGSTTLYVNDSRGRPTRITEANGSSAARVTTTTWHPTLHLPTQITEPNRTVSFTHDAQGNILTRTITAGTQSRKWTYTYDTLGHVLTATDPRGAKTTYAYDAAGNQISIANALGHVTTTTSFDPSGRPLTIKDPNNLVTTLTYDLRGRVTSTTAGAEKTLFSYDAAGNLSTLTAPDGSVLTYTYDAAHRLTKIKDALNNATTYTLDAAGNRTKIQDADATGVIKRTRSATYDALGRLIQTIGGQGQTTAYTYDGNGNRTKVTDPLSRAGTATYDSLNRLTLAVDANNGNTTYTYDVRDNVTAVRDARFLTTSYTVDALDNKTTATSPDTGGTTRTFDAIGNVLTSTDARGVKTTVTYDALNRPLTRTYTDTTPPVTFTYDEGANGIGHLTSMADGTGTTTWTYDQHGRVLKKTQNMGIAALSTTMTYDAAGRLATITYPSGRVIDISRNAGGQVADVTSGTTTLIGNITYTAWGAAASWTSASGTTYARGFDADGRLTAITFGGTAIGYTTDAADRITAITESGLPTKSFGCDTLGRLTSYTAGTITQAYTYDAVGNRTRLTSGAATTNYTIASNSNRVSGATGARTATYTYNTSGSVVASVDAGVTNYHGYNAEGGRVATYAATFSSFNAFNGLGERVIRNGYGAIPQIGAIFVYDDAHHLLGEYDLGGHPIQETVWLGEAPIATIKGGQTYAVYPDHVGAPHAIADQAGKTVWLWDHDPFGNGSPTGTFTYNLRFPGQYYDAETGLLYNMARDYNPVLGRYLQSDPIGLDGGINTYAYVGGNPVSFGDPKGLSAVDWLRDAAVGWLKKKGFDTALDASGGAMAPEDQRSQQYKQLAYDLAYIVGSAALKIAESTTPWGLAWNVISEVFSPIRGGDRDIDEGFTPERIEQLKRMHALEQAARRKNLNSFLDDLENGASINIKNPMCAAPAATRLR